jgi:hypothetical protein
MKQDFEITYVATDEAAALLDVVALEDKLNSSLHLKDYGSGIQEIFFTIIAVPDNNTIHENEVFFRKAERALEGALKLDYNALLNSTGTESSALMIQLFSSLFDFDMVRMIPDFDFDRFRKDLKEIK